MDWEDVRPKTQAAYVLGQKLDNMSVEELAETVAQLRREIERVEAELTAKRARQAAASQLFND